MLFTNAASHSHSGGGSYETVLSIAATHKGVAMVMGERCTSDNTGDQYLQVTVDGNVVVTDLWCPLRDSPGFFFGGLYNFSSSILIEHKSDKANTVCRVSYYSA